MPKSALTRKLIATTIVFNTATGMAAEARRPLPPLPGKLLIEDGRQQSFETSLVELSTGKTRRMPRSELSRSRTSADTWAAGQPAGSGTLLRTDPLGNLAFLEGATMNVLASINLVPLRERGLDPQFRSAIPSPDGKYLLGYWQPNQEGQPRLYVIGRELKLIENGSPLRYRAQGATNALDWMPDGRYLYLAGDNVVIAKPGEGIVSQTRLELPPGVDTEGASLKVSPDGRHLLLTLETQGKVALGLLYAVRIGDSQVRLLTQPAPRLANGLVRLSLQGASWSPDGRWIAFVIRGLNPGAPGYYQACQSVQVIPFDGAAHQVGDAEGEERRAVLLPGERKPLAACGGINWLP
ncbi:TolB family protein [Pseudoduganella sp. HUAS MS19]